MDVWKASWRCFVQLVHCSTKLKLAHFVLAQKEKCVDQPTSQRVNVAHFTRAMADDDVATHRSTARAQTMTAARGHASHTHTLTFAHCVWQLQSSCQVAAQLRCKLGRFAQGQNSRVRHWRHSSSALLFSVRASTCRLVPRTRCCTLAHPGVCNAAVSDVPNRPPFVTWSIVFSDVLCRNKAIHSWPYS